jgi:hypothetical protein
MPETKIPTPESSFGLGLVENPRPRTAPTDLGETAINAKTKAIDYSRVLTSQQIRELEKKIAEEEHGREVEERCRPVEQILCSAEFMRKIKTMGKQAVARSCFVVYDDGSSSELVPLSGHEPYDLFEDTNPNKPTKVDEFRELFVSNDDTGEIKLKTGISMLVYTPDLSHRETEVTPSLSDIELLERASEHYPGITEITVLQRGKYTDLLLCRRNPESGHRKSIIHTLSKRASQDTVRFAMMVEGLNIAETHLNGSKSAYHKQVTDATHILNHRIAA